MPEHEDTTGGSALLDQLLYDASPLDAIWRQDDSLATVPGVPEPSAPTGKRAHGTALVPSGCAAAVSGVVLPEV
jgi:hypothetical protein